jgi:hypothetical protein
MWWKDFVKHFVSLVKMTESMDAVLTITDRRCKAGLQAKIEELFQLAKVAGMR